MCLKCISAEWKKWSKMFGKDSTVSRSSSEAGIVSQSPINPPLCTSTNPNDLGNLFEFKHRREPRSGFRRRKVHDIPRGVEQSLKRVSGHNGGRWPRTTDGHTPRWVKGTVRSFVRPKSEILRKITNPPHSYGRRRRGHGEEPIRFLFHPLQRPEKGRR